MDSSSSDNEDGCCDGSTADRPTAAAAAPGPERKHRPQQQRLESSFQLPLQKRKRMSRDGKIPTANKMRQTPILFTSVPSSSSSSSAGTVSDGLSSERIVVDLFACVGGFSTGASIAGHTIGLAIDCDEKALAIHEANHPTTLHKVMLLGTDTEAELVDLIRSVVPDGAEWHLHGSPPCTKLSGAREMSAPTQDTIKKGEEEGLCLVDWYLDFAERMQPTSWSMEQVDCVPVRSTLKERLRRNKAWTDYEVVEFAKFGVPQTRTRMIAGSPSLIYRIRFGKGMRVSNIATVRNAIEEIPEGTVYIRCNWHRETKQEDTEEARNGEFINDRAQKLCRTLDEPAWTVLANSPLQWWNRRYARIRNLNVKETLLLQTFPDTYKPAADSTVADFLKGIGNAVPCLFVCKLMSVVVVVGS